MATMNGLNRYPVWWRYGSAAAAVGVSLVLSIVLAPISINNYFLLFFPAVAFAAWVGGLKAAIFAIGLSVLSADYYLTPPIYAFGLGVGGLFDVVLFCLVALFISGLIDQMNRTQRARGQLAAIVEGSDDAIVANDLDGIVTSWNVGAEHMYGYRADEMVGRTCAKLIPPYYPDETPEILARIRQGERIRHFTTRRRRKDGTLLDISLTVSPIYDQAGRVVGASKIARDVTERKQAEMARRESDARFRSLFENMLNGFAYCKMEFDQGRPHDFVYLDVNTAFETLTGLKDVVGKRVSEVIPGIQEADPELFELYGRVALTGQPEQCERYLNSLGMWFSISIYSPAKEHFVSVFDVITERKRAEARNQELNRVLEQQNAQVQSYANMLEQRVAERTHELEEALHQLQRADKAKLRMLSNVSHEMRTPLSSIIGFSGLLTQREVPKDAQYRYLEAINTEGRRLLSLINDFLDLQHFYTNPDKLRLGSFDLAMLIQDITRRYHADRYQQWSIRLDVPPSLPVYADKERIQQVISNLLSNAVKYSPNGGEILISVCCEDQAVFFSIQDHGLGIPKEELGQLFEPFQRGEIAEQQRVVGTGLGLALCREIIEAHHGRIWAASDGLHQGATFSFVLPNGTPVLKLEKLPENCSSEASLRAGAS